MNCLLVIPGTFIACGEGCNFCSDECRVFYEESCRIMLQSAITTYMHKKGIGRKKFAIERGWTLERVHALFHEDARLDHLARTVATLLCESLD